MASDYFLDRLNEDSDDVRKGVMSYDESSATHMGASDKYSGITALEGDWKSTSTAVNIKVIRLSEVYLIAAEAAFKLGQMQNAADMLNVIRRRAANRTGAPYAPGGAFGIAGAPPSTMVGDPYAPGFNQSTAQAAMEIAAGDVTLDFILHERSRELIIEEQRRRTLVRMGVLYERIMKYNPTSAKTIKPFNQLWPIPLTVIDSNTGAVIEQNPGYN